LEVAYYDPRPPRRRADEPYSLTVDLENAARVGLISNSFPDSGRFAEHVGQALTSLIPRVTTLRYSKPDSSPATAETRARIARECDAVISAYGH
jgi:hypothetical protein